MPRLPDELLNSVIYLYTPNSDQGGGTGFLISFEEQGINCIYAITNAHVLEGGCTRIRINKADGTRSFITTNDSQWFYDRKPKGEDIAICRLDLPTDGTYSYSSIHRNMFLTKDIAQSLNIGIGDEVFLTGRFVHHEGRQRNLPTVLFGNISMMPYENVWQGSRSYYQESYLVELRSVPGYSGSPVFVYRTGLEFLPYTDNVQLGSSQLWLLGVLWGGFPPQTMSNGTVLLTSMMGVVPIWKLVELLGRREVAVEREQFAAKRGQEEKKKGGSITMLAADSPEFTEEEFENALRKVSRPNEVPPDVETSETSE